MPFKILNATQVKVKIHQDQWNQRKDWTNTTLTDMIKKKKFEKGNGSAMVNVSSAKINLKTKLDAIKEGLASCLNLKTSDFSIVSLFFGKNRFGPHGHKVVKLDNVADSETLEEVVWPVLEPNVHDCVLPPGTWKSLLNETKGDRGKAQKMLDVQLKEAELCTWQQSFIEWAQHQDDNFVLGFEIKFTNVKSTASNVGGTTATTSK